MRSAKNTLNNDHGFTLIEVAVAVFILGLAFTQLVAWQTRELDLYINERSRIKAALYAQYLMTILEVQDQAPELGAQDGKLEDELREEGYFDTDELNDKSVSTEIADWTYKRTVSKIDISKYKNDALRRIEMEISWGDSANQSFTLIYFIRTSGDEEDSEEDNGET